MMSYLPLASVEIVLASASATRARLLANAGVRFRVRVAPIDEEDRKANLRAAGARAVDTALALAEAKARAVAELEHGRVVIGADQILEIDGEALDKPADAAAAAMQLRQLSGRAHDQVSCACAVRDGELLWSSGQRATLHVRDLSQTFIDAYVDAVGPVVTNGPGAYQLEGLGAQLFTRIDGDFFVVLGLPLLPLLAFLRDRGVMAS